MSPFALACLQIANEEGNTESLEAIRNKAFESLSGGNAKAVTTTTINGKSFSYNISKPADVLFSEVSWAIKQFNIGVIRNTTFDFTLLF
jgi:hypothetical protein